MSYVTQLEDAVQGQAARISTLQHMVIAISGQYCTCDECAPTELSKWEREAMNREIQAA